LKFLLARLFRFNRPRILGIGRVSRFLLKKDLFSGILNKSNLGVKFYSNPGDAVDQIMLRTGEYEPHVLNAITDNLLLNDCFWDIGSNVGFHSIQVKSLFPNALVYSFEPNPMIFSRQLLNVNLNFQEINMFNFGLARLTGFAALAVKADGNSGLSSFVPWEKIEYDAELLLPVFSGDDLISMQIVQLPNIIKIDVEGYEFEVFKGMENTLQNVSVRAVIFETRGFRPNSNLGKLLTSFGFTEFTSLHADLDWLAKRPHISSL
jgi:FkbM family methyltransferase